MSKSANLLSLAGEAEKKIALPDTLFGQPASPILSATAVRIHLSNKRKSPAKTKTRSEVQKTTAKMYRQKGTGRARHGAYSAPIFVGGGVAHGPDGSQNYKKSMTKKNIRRSIASALTEKATDGMIALLSDPKKFEGKTKEVLTVVGKLIQQKEKLLVVTAVKQQLYRRAFANLDRVTNATPNQLNTYLIMNNDKVLFTDLGLQETLARFK